MATVNRATFYDHYTDKFTLFEAMAGDCHELLKERNIRFDGTCASAIEAIVLAICDYLNEITRTKSSVRARDLLVRYWTPLSQGAIRIVVLECLAKHAPRTRVSHYVLASTISWAIYGAIREWFYSKKRHRSDEIVLCYQCPWSGIRSRGRHGSWCIAPNAPV